MKRKLKPGDWVEVRSKAEILSTLDAEGCFEGMIFMPEMLQYCGKRLRVYKRAHKTCDYTTEYPYRSRWIDDAVILETRCDGSCHDGCQAGCTLVWKEVWLKMASRDIALSVPNAPASADVPGCTEAALLQKTRVTDPKDGLPRYLCQSTVVQKGTTPLAWWDVRQYVEDYTSGNVTFFQLFKGLTYAAFYNLSQSGIGLGPPMRWFYDKFHWVWRGPKFPRTPGLIPDGMPTPAVSLNLQPGELVRIKPQEEILKTVTVSNRNRGMFWDAELVPYCGGTYKVLSRVNKLISEQTGKMMEMKNPCIILDSVVCQAKYSACRMFCPRAMYPYWREIWLERVEGPDGAVSTTRQRENVEALAPSGKPQG